MQSTFFTVVPSEENAKALYQSTQEIILQKLASIISQIGQQLPMGLSYEVARFNPATTGIINPALFHYYFKLKDSIASNNLDNILDVISLLINHPVYVNNAQSGRPHIVSALTSEWERELLTDTVRRDSISEFGMENNYEIVRPIFHEQLITQEKNILLALNILKETDNSHYCSATHNLYAIKLFEGSVRGFSYQAAYGNIYIRVPAESDNHAAYYLEHIVHECAHQYLFALQLMDPVVLNDKSELYDAPIRKQKRPMDGVFHACFVLARMVRCFRKTNEHINEKYNSQFRERIEAWFDKSYQVVKEYGQLSEQGKSLFLTFKECAYEQ